MADEAVQGVIEAVDKVKESRALITHELDQLKTLQRQVEHSEKQALDFLHSQFAIVQKNFTKLLRERESELEKEIKKTAKQDKNALCDLEKELQTTLDNIATFMAKGKELLMSDHDENVSNMKSFAIDSQAADLNSDLQVPAPQEVVCIHLDLPSGLEQEVTSLVEDYGTVFATAPVAITDVKERPGAVMVQWTETDEESLGLSEFRLQFHNGAVTYENQHQATFTNAYKGEATSFLLQRLLRGQSYSLRVSGRVAGATVWSPWSIPLVISTQIPHFKWSESKDYTLSSDSRTCEKSCQSEAVMSSDGPSLRVGHTIKFMVLDTGKASDFDGIFLSSQRPSPERMKCLPGVLVTVKGQIFIDGDEKLTQFPPLAKKSFVCFETEKLPSEKVKVNIEVDGKYIAAFDWSVSKASSVSMVPGLATVEDSNPSLYYGAQFIEPGWKVSVE